MMPSEEPPRQLPPRAPLKLTEKSRMGLQPSHESAERNSFQPMSTSLSWSNSHLARARSTFQTVSIGSWVNRGNPLPIDAGSRLTSPVILDSLLSGCQYQNRQKLK